MQRNNGAGPYNPDQWDFNQSQSVNEEAFDDQSMAGGTPGSRSLYSSLRQEALADFKALDGYWTRIIVRDMNCKGDDFLPDVLIV